MAWITPVTDRTLEDVLDAKNNQTGMLGKKGAMDYPDLNRIEDNYKYLIGLLNGAGYYNQFESRHVTETWKEPVKLPPDEHTLLLLHGEDFTDSSEYNRTINNSGCSISDIAKFGKSIYFTNLNKLESIESIFDVNSQFTIDFWARHNQIKSYATYFCGFTNNNTLKLQVVNGKITLFIQGTSFQQVIKYSPSVNQWFHFAMTGNNKAIKVYINGVLKSSFTISNTLANSNILIGLNPGQDNNGSIEGYIDEFRISDIVRWTSDFIPPTSPYIINGGTEVVEKSKTFTDWQKDNIFFKPEADRIRRNLNKLSQIYLKGLGLPVLDFNDSLDYIEANRWEDIELETYNAFDRMKQSYKYCGTQTCGGGTL